jgi:16S rRNA (cytosine1407-C5)-methyltransferase
MKRKNKSSELPRSNAELIQDQLSRFQPLLSIEEFSELTSQLATPLLPCLRINPFKSTSGFVNDLQERYGWQLIPIPFCPTGFRVIVNHGPAVSSTVEHLTGMYYIQEAASMLPVELFTIKPGNNDLTLDLAASPGGKTTHLVDKTHDEGLIIANDSSLGRIQALKIVLQHWGAESTAVTRFPGESFGNWFPETFDRALIDAPCSMQGLRTTDTHPAHSVSHKESLGLSSRQIGLVLSALQAVRVGGEVVYSTCTLAPEEDEIVVDAILQATKGMVLLENAQSVLPRPAPGLTQFEQKIFSPDMANTIRLWPNRYDTAGFFACKFIKIDSIRYSQKVAPTHSMEKAGFCELTFKERNSFVQEFEEQSGFPLLQHLESLHRTLVRRDKNVFVFPQIFMDRFSTLPVQSVGILLGSTEHEVFVPSFEWITRFGKRCPNLIIGLDADQSSKWSKGYDLQGISTAGGEKTLIKVVLDENDRIIGRGALESGILKNLDSRRFR